MVGFFLHSTECDLINVSHIHTLRQVDLETSDASLRFHGEGSIERLSVAVDWLAGSVRLCSEAVNLQRLPVRLFLGVVAVDTSCSFARAIVCVVKHAVDDSHHVAAYIDD